MVREHNCTRSRQMGDSLTQLTFTSRQFFCDWSDSDSLIVYRITLGDSSGIWIMGSDGSKNRMLVRHGSFPSFGLGDSVMFVESIPPDYKDAHMVVMNPVDSTTREILRWTTAGPITWHLNPRFSPDGKTIAMDKGLNVWTMTAEGDNLTQLTFNEGRFPNWSPDGSKISYIHATVEGGTLWVMNADGSDMTQIPGW